MPDKARSAYIAMISSTYSSTTNNKGLSDKEKVKPDIPVSLQTFNAETTKLEQRMLEKIMTPEENFNIIRYRISKFERLTAENKGEELERAEEGDRINAAELLFASILTKKKEKKELSAALLEYALKEGMMPSVIYDVLSYKGDFFKQFYSTNLMNSVRKEISEQGFIDLKAHDFLLTLHLMRSMPRELLEIGMEFNLPWLKLSEKVYKNKSQLLEPEKLREKLSQLSALEKIREELSKVLSKSSSSYESKPTQHENKVNKLAEKLSKLLINKALQEVLESQSATTKSGGYVETGNCEAKAGGGDLYVVTRDSGCSQVDAQSSSLMGEDWQHVHRDEIDG